jgi:curved DNA-binding protein CbpA
MSAPLAGKFQDHYALLGVDPRCAQEAIQVAYDRMVKKYDPSNKQTGDHDKFEAVKLAYEVLSDSMLRSEFDKVKGVEQEDSNQLFSGFEFFEALGRQTGLRAALLCLLYDRRRKKPLKPALSIRQVESVLTTTNDELTFSLFYLKQRGLVQSDDKSNLQITVDGMERLERDRPAPEDVFPFLKASAMPASTRAALAGATTKRSGIAALASAALVGSGPDSAGPSSRTLNSGAADLGTLDSGISGSGVAGSGVSGSSSAESNALESGALEPGTSDAGAGEPGTESGIVAESGLAQSGIAESGTREIPGETGMAGSRAEESGSRESGARDSSKTEPNTLASKAARGEMESVSKVLTRALARR